MSAAAIFALWIAAAPAPKSAAQLLAEARAAFEGLEYDRVVPLAKQILTRDPLDIEQRLDAYLLLGSSLAIIGDTIDAEKPFRFLLRGRPDFEMSADTSPKILAVFRKVQVEERAIASQMKELERKRIVHELALIGGPPAKVQGGEAVVFGFTLRDPFAVVAEVKVQYRKRSEKSYSSLALKRDDRGGWTGEIPGAWTANANGFVLEWFLTSSDGRAMELLTRGTSDAPESLIVGPGTVPEISEPFYQTAWFWAAAGLVAVAGGAAGYYAYSKSSELPKTDLGNYKVAPH